MGLPQFTHSQSAKPTKRPPQAQSPPLNKTISESWEPSPIKGEEITCKFEYVSTSGLNRQVIEHGAPEHQGEAIIMTFAALSTESPRMKGLTVGAPVHEAELLKLSSNGGIMLLEGGAGPLGENISIYQINTKTGLAVWTKNYIILGFPRGSVSIGKCW